VTANIDDRAWRLADLRHVSGLSIPAEAPVTIALVPRRPGSFAIDEISRGVYPIEVAFASGRLGGSPGHIIAKLPVTEISRVLVDREGATVYGKPYPKVTFALRSYTPLTFGLGMDSYGFNATRAVSAAWQLQEVFAFLGGRALRFSGEADLTPRDFELLVAEGFRQLGARVRHTGESGDGGVDVEVELPGARLVVVQCKRFETPVGPGPVRELLGSMVIRQAGLGVLVASHGYSDAARQSAAGRNVLLLEPSDFAPLDPRPFGLPFAEPKTTTRLDQTGDEWIMPPDQLLGSVIEGDLPAFAPGLPDPIWRSFLTPIAIGAFYGFVGTGLGQFVPFVARLGVPIMWVLTASVIVAVMVVIERRVQWNKGTRCSNCRHAAHAHAIHPLSPMRLVFHCTECSFDSKSGCHWMLPGPASPFVRHGNLVLLHQNFSGDFRRVRVERADDLDGQPREWSILAEFGLDHGHSWITDPTGTRTTWYREIPLASGGRPGPASEARRGATLAVPRPSVRDAFTFTHMMVERSYGWKGPGPWSDVALIPVEWSDNPPTFIDSGARRFAWYRFRWCDSAGKALGSPSDPVQPFAITPLRVPGADYLWSTGMPFRVQPSTPTLSAEPTPAESSG
jgi:restriction endonuclease